MYTANRPVRTVVVHKPGCRVIPWTQLESCGCGDTGERNNPRWFCEIHVSMEGLEEFFNRRHWAVLLCSLCFGKD
jgi:hypothetical protein